MLIYNIVVIYINNNNYDTQLFSILLTDLEDTITSDFVKDINNLETCKSLLIAIPYLAYCFGL